MRPPRVWGPAYGWVVAQPFLPLTVSVRQHGSDLLVSAAGELDFGAARLFELAVLERVPSAGASMLLDLGDVTFCDSTGIAALLRLRERCVELGHDFRISRVDGRVRRILRIAGVADTLGVPEVLGVEDRLDVELPPRDGQP